MSIQTNGPQRVPERDATKPQAGLLCVLYAPRQRTSVDVSPYKSPNVYLDVLIG
jgi:hypothetical protein